MVQRLCATDADILRFTVEDLDPDQGRPARDDLRERVHGVPELARPPGDPLDAAEDRADLARLAAAGERDTPLYVQPARRSAASTPPTPCRVGGDPRSRRSSPRRFGPTRGVTIVLGLALGILLGIGLAFLIERLDTRIRSAGEAEAILGLPVLGEPLATPDPPPGEQEPRLDARVPVRLLCRGRASFVQTSSSRTSTSVLGRHGHERGRRRGEDDGRVRSRARPQRSGSFRRSLRPRSSLAHGARQVWPVRQARPRRRRVRARAARERARPDSLGDPEPSVPV